MVLNLGSIPKAGAMKERLKPYKWKCEYGTAQTVYYSKDIKVFSEILKEKYLLVDTETNDVVRDRELRLVQVGKGKRAWILDTSETGEPHIHALMDSGAVFISHNSAFDLLTLALWRYEDKEDAYQWCIDKALRGEVICTMVTEQIVQSVKWFNKLSALAAEEGIPNTHEIEFEAYATKCGYSTSNKYAAVSINDEYYLRYAAYDIWQLKAVYKRLKTDCKRLVVKDEIIASILYAVLRHRGMRLDVDKASNFYNELEVKRNSMRKKLKKQGILSENSGVQIAKALSGYNAKMLTKTPTGKIATNKAVLENLTKPKGAARIASQVLATRSLTKDMASAVNLIGNSDGKRVYPTLRVIGTVTGRSSCEEPNLQQMNKHTGDSRVRGILMADPGHVIVSVDFDGFELRGIAEITEDKRLKKKLYKGADIHGEIALQVFGDDFSEQERQYTKNGLFALLYGGGNAKVARTIGCTVEQVKGIKESWNDLYPQANKISRKWSREAEMQGFTELSNGWSPRMPRDDKGKPLGYFAVNYQIQGHTAFIFRQAAIHLARAGLWKYVRMVVHDEFVLSVPKKKAQKVMKKFIKVAQLETENMMYTTSGNVYTEYWGEL